MSGKKATVNLGVCKLCQKFTEAFVWCNIISQSALHGMLWPTNVVDNSVYVKLKQTKH